MRISPAGHCPPLWAPSFPAASYPTRKATAAPWVEGDKFFASCMFEWEDGSFSMPFIPRDPNGPIAQIASWIPLYTPFVMMNRIAASPPVFDVVGTGVVLVGFDVLVLWGCGRVFRTAILRTGQPPRIIELLRWIRDR
jgi:hypothetical protein